MSEEPANLRQEVERRAKYGPDVDIARLVLDLGNEEGPQPLPAGWSRGPAGDCFANAGERANKYGLLYVEGYAVSRSSEGMIGVEAIPHAWVSDGDKAIEVTWDESGVAYFGVRMCWPIYDLLADHYGEDSVLPGLSDPQR